MKSVEKYLDLAVDCLVLGLVYSFLLQYFPLDYLLLDTVITGGDTGSHFKTAEYLKEVLLPEGKVIGWYPGNYGGYPLFLMYFPVLFVAAVGLSVFMPLTVSFKLVAVIGPIMLPVCTYLMLKLCRFRFPGPGIGAAASLIFLLNTSHSMWGGNLGSTFAGEFSYAFSFSLTFVMFGLLYRLMEQIQSEDEPFDLKLLLAAIAVLYLVGLSHGFTLVICSIAASYFLLSPGFFLKKALVILVIFGTSGLLFAAWFMQLVFNSPYTTGFNVVWTFSSIREVVPDILVPTLVLYLLATVYALIPQRFGWQILRWNERSFLFFSWFIIGVCVICFYSAELLGLPDIRFIPFAHFLVTVLGAAFLGTTLGLLFSKPIVRRLLPLMGFCVCILWVLDFPSNSRQWSEWNLKGFEEAPGWPIYQSVIDVVAGDNAAPRVAYEHAAITNGLGTVRAFESLPLFAGRATVEGLYFQSSLLSPFVFYVQSLYSKEISCPFPDYPCSRFDLKRAFDYLALFNVNQLILVSDEAREEARTLADWYELQSNIPYSDYEIWKLRHQDGHYVEVLNAAPTYIEPKDYRHDFYRWFRSYEPGKQHLYTVPEAFARVHGIDAITPRLEDNSVIDTGECKIDESIGNETIEFRTNCIGQPHLIKVAYNPGWKVEGADGPYLASPAYLLVYPTAPDVKLVFDNSGPRHIGIIMSVLGLVLLAVLVAMLFVSYATRVALLHRYGAWLERVPWNRAAYGMFIVLFVALLGFTAYGLFTPQYQGMFKKIERAYTAKDYTTAQEGFSAITARWESEPTLDRVHYFLGLSYFLDNKCEQAEVAFRDILAYTDSEYLAEAHYHIGICARDSQQYDRARAEFNYVIDELADPIWSEHARARLGELP